ncbi:metallophosphoesterase [Vibrio campbellii]|nr:metallophosphoesterase [Vibrio campbellii]
MKNSISIALLLTLISGCSKTSKLNSEETFLRNFPSVSNLEHPTILLYADNQQANILSMPIFEQSMLTEKTVNTAHRYSALDAYALDVVDYINDKFSDTLIIHAGDALNNSCFNEFEAFKLRMNESQQEWYVAPGNHDGYYLGISSPNKWTKSFTEGNILLDERSGWADVCSSYTETAKRLSRNDGMRKIMDKYSFVREYISMLNIESYKELDYTWRNSSNNDEMAIRCSDNLVSSRKHLKEICWTVNKSIENKGKNYNENVDSEGNEVLEKSAWQHFIVQLIEIPHSSQPSHVLLIDTASYGNDIAVNDNGELKVDGFGAADNAHFSLHQQKLVMTWAQNEEYNIKAIVGHHPLEDLDLGSIHRLAELSKKLQNRTSLKENKLLYFSGDTHDGYDLFHNSYHREKYKDDEQNSDLNNISNLDTSLNLREVNLGALIDAPIEYATLNLKKDGSLNINRYSLTPLLQESDNLDTLKKSELGYAKKYAIMDGLWKQCNQKFDYTPHGDRSDPLGLKTTPLFDRTLKIRQPNSYLGVPYLGGKDTRRKSLLAYKINRMSELANVHHQQAEFSKNAILKDESYLNKIDSTRSALENLRKDNFTSYYHDDFKSGLFYLAVSSLESLILYQSKELSNSKDESALLYKRCSALYEAEREYKTGYFG